MIIGLAGFKRTGKDTFASYFPSNFTRMAFAEPLKQAAAIIYDVPITVFEDELKDATNEKWGITHRDMFINVGQKMREVGPDHWVRLMKMRIMSDFQRYQRANITDQHILITDVRQPNELQMIEHLGGAVYLVQRKGVAWNGHPTEKMATQLEHFAGRIENLLPLGSTDPELLRKSAEHFRLASYEVISYETERQCAPTATNAEPKR
ncbi:MAG: hypothetical protein E6Q97_08715 [Desulfurellales bacterium]|nr:MAG: hypothetical protein E6Q97_08715 [Desulfurellales bacterium]